MKLTSRALFGTSAFLFSGLTAALLPATATAAATLQIVEGSGEFQFLQSAVTVVKPQALTLQWTTDQAAATGGTWQVTNAASQVVASGEAAAPTPGHFLRFTLPANAFLLAPTVGAATKFNIRITPHNAANANLDAPSPTVLVTEVPDTAQPPIVLGEAARFPKVEVFSYDEKIGVVPQTQIHFAGADVTLRVSNKTAKATDPMWLSLKDFNVLMRQNSARVAIPALAAGASQLVTVHLDAVLPPAQSQLPQDQQYSKWNAQYREACGVQLRTVLDWRGPQANTPMGDHLESLLVKEGWGDYAKVPPSVPICDGKVCVSVCQIEKNLRAQLDGKVTGYSYFVGNYPKFGSGGQARTYVDGDVGFTSSTKITVASVSKFVTAVAAVRILDKAGVSLDAPIGPYLPSDWSSTSAYVKGITFAQLLGQRSGIKDYGNVSQDYVQLKKFFTASVSSRGATGCQKSDAQNVANPINPKDMGWCYSNYNFAIMRVLLPRVAGFAEDANQGTRPQTLASQYVKLVQQNVFDLVGQTGVTCKPPALYPGNASYAYAYRNAGSQVHGHDFGDASLICGAAGWYLSVEDMAKVLLSLNAKDGKILSATMGKDLFDTMRKRGLGWDMVSNTELEKNGGWSANCDDDKVCDTVSTSVAQFGPVVGPRLVGVLFVNSGGAGAQGVLEKAYYDAVFNKP